MKVVSEPPYQTIKHESLWNSSNNVWNRHGDIKQNIRRKTAQVKSISCSSIAVLPFIVGRKIKFQQGTITICWRFHWTVESKQIAIVPRNSMRMMRVKTFSPYLRCFFQVQLLPPPVFIVIFSFKTILHVREMQLMLTCILGRRYVIVEKIS